MSNSLTQKTFFPKQISAVSADAVESLSKEGFFADYFRNAQGAMEFFHDNLCRSLMGKFISGEDLEWTLQELEETIMNSICEFTVIELEEEGMIYRFDDSVVLSEKGKSVLNLK